MLQVGKRITILLGVAILLAASVVLAQAQAGLWTENWNEYLLVQMGQTGQGHTTEPTVADRDRPGRWGAWTIKGDPESDQDDNIPIIQIATDGGPAGHYGYTTIRVDDANAVFGDQSAGRWILAPNSSLTGFEINSEFQVTNGDIFVHFRQAVIRDQARFEVLLRNDDTDPHRVGLRHLADFTTNSIIDSISYPFLPGRGMVTSEISLTGTDIPDYFEMFDDAKSPTVGLRNTLKLEDATPPDRVALGWWVSLQGSDWNFTPVPDRIVPDYGWAIWWDPVLLNPGQSRTIITYFGMAAASSSWTSGTPPRQDPYCVAVQGPRTLAINYDPTQSPENMLQPNPFKIKAYVYNLWKDTISYENVNVHLTLPPGLELVEGTPTQEISNIAPGTEGLPATWLVKATGIVTGELTYWVSASANPLLQKTVARSIVIPATGTTQFRRGWQMVSVPLKFSDPRLEVALNLAPDTYRAYYWDPQVADYRPPMTIAPGNGFWLNSTVDMDTVTVRVAADARPLSGTESYRIVLYSGWDQFGDPFLYGMPWGRLKVLGSPQDGLLSIDEAAARNLIRLTIYWWDPIAGEYQYSSDPTTVLVPWQSYWIRALQACELIVPPVEQVGGGISGSTTRSRLSQASSTAGSGSGGWRLNLVARAGNAVDSRSMLGVDTRASDGYDAADVERPPSPGNYVAIGFPHRDWGTNSGNYLTDIRRSTTGTQVWEFEVASDQQNTDVVLTWPTIMKVPKQYNLKLVDVDGSVTKYMRTTSSYRYNSGSGGARRFRFVVEPAGSSGLLVTGLSVNTSRALGGATISYNLSADATTDVRIKSLAGRTVRSLATGRGATRGISSLSWNYRNEAGNTVPAGSYLIEVVATTPEGEVAKAIRPFLVAR
jgi:hypothetical protein